MLATKQHLELELELDLGSDAFISLEFLRSFLRCHFAGKPVVAVFSDKNNSGLVQSRTAFHKFSVVLTFATIFLPNIGSRCYDL